MKNIGKVISGVLLAIQLVLEAVAIGLFWMLKMLPSGLFAAVIGVFIVLLAVSALLMRQSSKKEKGAVSLRRILGWILSLVIIVIGVVGDFALIKAYQTMNSVTGQVVSSVVGIYVKQEDPAQSLDDAGEYVFGFSNAYDGEAIQETIGEIRNQLGENVNLQEYDTVFTAVDALYEGEVEAVLLSSAYIGVLEGIEAYKNFSTETRILMDHTVNIEVVVPTPGPDVSEKPEWYEKPQSADDPFVIYLSGSDTRSDVLTTSRSDVNILAAVNPKTGQILLVNTPRDYYVANPAMGGAMDKLTHCGIYGVEYSMETLSQLYNIPVHYNAQVNFGGFRTLINAVGGITVHSDVAFATQDGYWIQQGENYMDGAKALSFARERYALAGGDNDRGNNQMKVITAVIDRLSSGAIISNYSQIMDSMQGMFATNLTTDEMMGLVRFQLAEMPQWKVVSYAVTGEGTFGETCSAPGMSLYVMQPNMDTVAKASDLIQRVLNGETLAAADLTS